MSEAELIFTALAELSTRQIAESTDATGMVENAEAGKKGGRIAKTARLELEAKTGKRSLQRKTICLRQKNKAYQTKKRSRRQ